MQKHKKRSESKLSKRRKQRIRQRNKRILISIIVAAVLIFGGTYAALYHYVNQTAETETNENIFVGPNKVTGMSKEEIKANLEQRLAEYSELKMELVADDKSKTVTLGDLGLAISNVDELAEKAVTYGKEGSIWSRFQQIYKLRKEAVVLEEAFVLSEDIEKILDKKTAKLERKAVNASVEKTGSGFHITEEIPGRRIDIEKTTEKIVEYLNKDWNYEDFKIELVVDVDEPDIKATDLETIQDELGSFYTVAGGGTRLQNLKRASYLLNGTVVMPGETISVEALTKPYTIKNGYVEGSAYESGQVVTSIGGGLCQVSTTLYNALLYAEVEIVQRYAHSMQVNYVKPSKDAAIAEGIKDLKFKNNYDTPILIEGYVDSSNYLRFYVYGKETRAKNRTVEFESETLDTTEFKKKYVADTGSAIGSMITEGTGIDGRTARLWKVVYENGKEVSRDKVNSSTYTPSTVTIKVGVASDNSEAASIVKNAISSQSKSKIEKAIAKAKKVIQEAEAEKAEKEDKEEEE